MEVQTSDGPAVLWLGARQLCHLSGYAPESGEIIGILKLKDGVSTDRKTDHAPLVAAKENEEVASSEW